MCPMRFILVFFSAVLAGYFAWRTVRSSPEVDPSLQDAAADTAPRKEARELNFKKVVQDGFWVFVDMASGRYLWRNIKEMRAPEKAAKS
ncbi:uncharacterized protein LOC116204957 [Punica granatum]|uniref:Uncharacterized protein LOC116204957 n=2 Tax=Punica granatum TaxID=22663 RepID=A0A6P8DFE5_PUNGR|nr:uncharacterized protein LOC116204957 [Punica granatum]PKI77345.1 hypothetical protein CRG98_002290 [Punica granatum]